VVDAARRRLCLGESQWLFARAGSGRPIAKVLLLLRIQLGGLVMNRTYCCSLAAAIVLAGGLAVAASENEPGVSDSEIKIGNTMPYSGPASAWGVIGKSEAAYFAMVNDQGGINGRKIKFITLDDGYSPPKTVEMVRKLVEEDQVMLLFQSLGTASNTVIQDYLNERKIPQLFVATGANKWNEPKNHPWTIGWQPSYRVEARIYGRYIIANVADRKIAVLYQNDDLGKDYVTGLREGLGDKADKLIVATKSYETTDPTIDSQIVALQGSGANVLLTVAAPKFAAQTIRKVYDIGWKPTHFMANISVSIKAVMQPAGLEKGIGIITAAYLKDPTDPQWQNTPEYEEWLTWMKKYNTSANVSDANAVYGYSVSQTMASVLRACGNDPTRANVMREAAAIRDQKLPMLLPGIYVSTSADDFAPIKQMQLAKFDGTIWKLFGEVISGSEK
jgi:branched-chain amino acid transport system substrate-binding protein